MEKENIVNELYPWCGGLILLLCNHYIKLTPFDLKSYDSILESIIQFSGLIIGFYTAMYGLVLVSNNNSLFKTFKSKGVDNIFKRNLTQSLGISFLTFVISVIMQEVRHLDKSVDAFVFKINFANIGFNIWLFITVVFILMSYRTIRLLLKILFVQVDITSSVKSTSENETAKEKKRKYDNLRE